LTSISPHLAFLLDLRRWRIGPSSLDTGRIYNKRCPGRRQEPWHAVSDPASLGAVVKRCIGDGELFQGNLATQMLL
jgi:hypothetical protein